MTTLPVPIAATAVRAGQDPLYRHSGGEAHGRSFLCGRRYRLAAGGPIEILWISHPLSDENPVTPPRCVTVVMGIRLCSPPATSRRLG